MELKAKVLANDGVSDGGSHLGQEAVTSSVEGNRVKIYCKYQQFFQCSGGKSTT